MFSSCEVGCRVWKSSPRLELDDAQVSWKINIARGASRWKVKATVGRCPKSANKRQWVVESYSAFYYLVLHSLSYSKRIFIHESNMSFATTSREALEVAGCCCEPESSARSASMWKPTLRPDFRFVSFFRPTQLWNDKTSGHCRSWFVLLHICLSGQLFSTPWNPIPNENAGNFCQVCVNKQNYFI